MQVSPIMLLKTHVEKMSVLGFAIMYMKINNLKDFAIMLMITKAVTRRNRIRNAMTFGADTPIGADEPVRQITIARICVAQNMCNKPFDAFPQHLVFLPHVQDNAGHTTEFTGANHAETRGRCVLRAGSSV